MDYSFVIAIIPVILIVAFIAWIAKRITEGERIDMKEGIVGVVILMVAVLIMVPMVSSTQVYTWDEDTGELVIQQNISGGSYAWDAYDDQIRSIVIKPGVTQIGNSAFDGATNLEYLSIPESVTDIGTNAFGVTFKDPFDETISAEDIPGSDFVGMGDGTLFLCDPDIFTYSTANVVTGLTTDASAAVNVVIPRTHNGNAVTGIGNNAFQQKQIVTVLAVPESEIATIGSNAFYNCTALESIKMPSSVTSIGASAFYYCSALTGIQLPNSVTSIGTGAFGYCSALTTANIPSSLTSIEGTVFASSGLASLDIPATVTSIGSNAFYNCMEITEVSFASGFSATIDTNAFRSWTFYASDGTTVLDKTSSSALAGKTFQGTASALVEVEPGQLTLTPQQIQQVHLHDTELQDLKDQISIEPLPLQPSLQEQELTA